MEDTRKYVRIASVVLIVGVIFCIAYTLIGQQKEKLFEEVYDCYSNGEFSNALSVAEKLPKPYNKYYSAYISYRVELDKWEGTGPELLEWLKNALETIDARNEDYTMLDKLYICSNCVDIQQELSDDNAWLKNAFVWYPQVQKVIDGFWEGYCDIFSRSYDLFAIEPENGIVTIPCQEIRALDEEMNQLYSDSMNSLDELIEKYCIEDNLYYDIGEREEEMDRSQEHYFDNFSLSCIYDINGKENIYISAQGAEKNYRLKDEIIFTMMVLGRPGLRKSDPTDVLVEYVRRLFQDSTLTINVHEGV